MKKMKTFLLVICLMFVLALIFSSCGGASSYEQSTGGNNAKNSTNNNGNSDNSYPSDYGEMEELDNENFAGAEPMPEEPPIDNNDTSGETYEDYGINPPISTEDTQLSTFSMDVDTGSYANVRRYLTYNNMLPPNEAVRVEEFLNYFNYNYELPNDETFKAHMEVAKSMYRDDKYMLRIGIQGKNVPPAERKRANLIFLIDVSGSMTYENKLPLVKKSMKYLLDNLKPDDRVGIAVYAGSAGIYLDSTLVKDKKKIHRAIDKLESGGSTNAEGGMRVAYEMCAENLIEDGINRVMLCSDGDANVGYVGPKELSDIVKEYRSDLGITLSTFGFGMGNYNDTLMEQLANLGDGNYAYIDTIEEAERLFGDKLISLLQVIARDSKVQVWFNKENVKTFRLLGYENRKLEDEEFEDDTVDAGEIGALHNVTALYELELTHDPSNERPLLELRMRWKEGLGEASIPSVTTFYENEVKESSEDASSFYGLAVNIGEFAEILRGSPYAEGSDLETVLEYTSQSLSRAKDEHRKKVDPKFDELINLMSKAYQISKPSS